MERLMFTATEKWREAEREVIMRQKVYPRWRSFSKEEAARRIALMQEIAEDYRVLAEKERLL